MEGDLEVNRKLDWLNWRISWIEWATAGEKRSFSRPLDGKSLPQLPPSTVTATGFNQPLTEDMDLWVREPGGRQRLRRGLPSRSVGELPPNSGPNSGLSPDTLAPPQRLTRSDSNVRLPTLAR